MASEITPLLSDAVVHENNADLDCETSVVPESTPNPLPKLQLFIVFAILLCEPICASVIYPFIAQLVGEVGITDDPTATGYYVGLIESLFFFTQGLFVLQWGRLSDKIRRRQPILLFGLVGLSVSILSFGFSKSFWGLIISRSLAGMLNGNIGVAKTVLGELTDETNHAPVFAMLPVMWITGTTFAPFMGGALQHPAERFPDVFGGIHLLREYPYLLPCFAAASFLAVAFIIGLMFLKETHPDRTHPAGDDKRHRISEEVAGPAPTLKAILTRPVIIAISNYACLSLLEISYFALLTLFLAVPISSGGLGFTPQQIGIILGVFGLLSGVVQFTLFPLAHKRWGARKIYLCGVSVFWVTYPAFAVMHAMASRAGKITPAIWVILVVQLTFSVMIDMCFSCIFIYVTSSAPTPALLGSINGLAQTLISFVRALGPAGATALFSLSVEKNLAGGYFVFFLLMSFTSVALCCGMFLPTSEKRATL